MAKIAKQAKKIDIIKKEDISHTNTSNNNNTPLYGEYYNKNVVYIYKDNSITRVTYNNKSNEYIERKYS